ncbi:HB2D protein, partial [Catharus fuscescens]|nr:HB2D protein [Catharus fuscescens]
QTCPAHTEVFQRMAKQECYFINGTEKVRFVERLIYNRMEDVRFDSDVGRFVGFTPAGEKWAQDLNNNPQWMEYKRGQADTYCRHNYVGVTPFSVERRVHSSPSQSIP